MAPTKEGDVYSVGIIMQEIITRNPPYEEVRAQMNIDGVYSLNSRHRNSESPDVTEGLVGGFN